MKARREELRVVTRGTCSDGGRGRLRVDVGGRWVLEVGAALRLP